MTDSDPDDAVLPLKDGTWVRLGEAQAVVGRLLAKAAEGQPGGADDAEAEEMMRVLDGLQKQARQIRVGDRVRNGSDGQIAFLRLILELAQQLQQTLTVTCVECGRQLSAESADVQLELTADVRPVFYCIDCRPRELSAG